jgi:hypothetical protein
MKASITMTTLLVALPLIVTDALADKPAAGTKGTVTAWEGGGTKVITVETCAATGDGYDYVSCSKILRDRVVDIVCKRGAGTYKWGFQVGDEKPFLMQTTTCK